ncbi:hypothetical protein AVEN_20909-1 [Araneus ventricosus]|uniref:Uncharacterized protein n=1 Tax=Araneus ventricosus TaxID=182803 RepID=A0A4Y2X546_ARAVE|nr:hypothetical protein AVEN_20909-1 [Araneus ventricosus]
MYEDSSKSKITRPLKENFNQRFQRDGWHFFILLLHVDMLVVEAFVPSINQCIEIGIEEISVKIVEPCLCSLLNFGIGSELKVTCCEIPAVGQCSHKSHRKNCTKAQRRN